MSTATAALDRIIVLLLALVLLAGGVAAILGAAGVDPVRSWAEGVDFTVAGRWAPNDWFTWVLAGIAVAGILLAIWFIAANARLRRPEPVVDAESDETGELRYTLGTVASGAAEHLQRLDGVRKVNSRAEVDRGRDTLTFTLNVANDAHLPPILAECSETAADLADAVDHGHDTGVRFLLHVDAQS
ncbi:hypothetical protein [Corynebacterium sp. 335C]